MFAGGNYEESLSVYEEYLARYPYSTAARDGAERARTALENAKREASAGGSRQTQKRKSPTLMQDIKRSVKRLFGGK